jgi:hypothetical protein
MIKFKEVLVENKYEATVLVSNFETGEVQGIILNDYDEQEPVLALVDSIVNSIEGIHQVDISFKKGYESSINNISREMLKRCLMNPSRFIELNAEIRY